MKKNVLVSIVGVLNYDGAHDIFQQMLVLADAARVKYVVNLAPHTHTHSPLALFW